MAGLVLFLAPVVIGTVVNPTSLLVGLVLNVIALFFLMRSVVATRAAKAWEEMERSKADPGNPTPAARG